ncbi:hypothetical protein BTE77_33935 [Ensifer adhaerens]|nr:hypothetical protein BTE77_33935 [Ensifer adhaerens]
MTRVTLGKSRVREIRPPGSVRAKPNGIATRPRPSYASSMMWKLPSWHSSKTNRILSRGGNSIARRNHS